MPDTRHKIANFNSPGPSEREGPRPVPSYDHIGNVVAVVDDTGAIVAAYEYDPFGNIIAQSGAEANEVPFRFSTKYFDSETGLYYYGYRFYSPLLGRWINRDPIEEEGGENLYALCSNRPSTTFDSDGQSEWTEESAMEALQKAIEDWRNNNWNFAADALQHFVNGANQQARMLPKGQKRFIPHVPIQESGVSKTLLHELQSYSRLPLPIRPARANAKGRGLFREP